MADLKAIHNLAESGEFRARFAAAIAAYVQVVAAEDPLTPRHAERMVTAAKALRRPRAYADELSLAAAASFGGSTPSDAQIEALVVQYWSLLAVELAPVP